MKKYCSTDACFDLYRGVEFVFPLMQGERISTLVLSSNRDALSESLKKFENAIEESCKNFDVVYFGVNETMNLHSGTKSNFAQFNVEMAIRNLAEYSADCKKEVLKRNCHSLEEYNAKYKIKDSLKTIVIIPSLENLLDSCSDAGQTKMNLMNILQMEEFSGVSVIACTTCSDVCCLDFRFINAFHNRMLFDVGSQELVPDISNGMYKDTQKLSSNEFYYFTFSNLNGRVLCV